MNDTQPSGALRDFLHTETASGIILVGAAIVGLVWANSPWDQSYVDLWHTTLSLGLGAHQFDWSLQHWINDGLMTFFFLLIGLEIKRELTVGHLSDRRAATLPVVAAVGGMVIPALLYFAIAGADTPRGWGIPMATDIALAVGVVSLLGARVSTGMRSFLLALAVADDVGAIIVIAVFYSGGIQFGYLALAAGSIVAIIVAGRQRLAWGWLYAVLGVLGWYSLYKAGIHPTLVGVALGLTLPAVVVRPDDDAHGLEHRLHPWVSYAIVPLFAMVNTGVPLSADAINEAVTSPLGVGIIVGLVVGKLIGIFGSTVVMVRFSGSELPEGSSRQTLAGIGLIAGIGFTVALLVAGLALEDPADLETATLAILIASVLAAVLGSAVILVRGKGHRTAG